MLLIGVLYSALLAISLFNTVLLIWLGLSVVLNTERRRGGVWLMGGGLAFGGVVFLAHSGVLIEGATRISTDLNVWWPLGWGGLLFDYDNDGWLDVFVANGNAHHEYTEEDVLMRNDGTGRFVDVANQSGPYFRQKYVGRGATYGDYDNDGDLDLVIVNLNDSTRLLRNDGGNRQGWLALKLLTADGKREAIGARVTVTTGSLAQIRDLIPVTGYLSQADSRLHFGLGSARRADAVEIRWPDGAVTRLADVEANRIVTIRQDTTPKNPDGS